MSGTGFNGAITRYGNDGLKIPVWFSSSANFYYQARITLTGSSRTYVSNFGYVASGSVGYTTVYATGLTRNKDYYATITIYYSSTNLSASSGNWQKGGVSPVTSTVPIPTYNDAPYSVSASYSSGKISVSITQYQGGEAEYINLDVIVSSRYGGTVATGTFRALSTTATYYIRNVTLQQGAYEIAVYSHNSAVEEDGKTRNSAFCKTTSLLLSCPSWSWTAASGSWNASSGSGNAYLSASYAAVTNNGRTRDFNHAVWNDMLDFLYNTACAMYKQSQINSSVTTAYMSSSDTVLTARKYNAFVTVVNAVIADTGVTMRTVSSGEIVRGVYLTEWVAYVNGVIANFINDW